MQNPTGCSSDNKAELTAMAAPRWSQETGVRRHYLASGMRPLIKSPTAATRRIANADPILWRAD